MRSLISGYMSIHLLIFRHQTPTGISQDTARPPDSETTTYNLHPIVVLAYTFRCSQDCPETRNALGYGINSSARYT